MHPTIVMVRIWIWHVRKPVYSWSLSHFVGSVAHRCKSYCSGQAPSPNSSDDGGNLQGLPLLHAPAVTTRPSDWQAGVRQGCAAMSWSCGLDSFKAHSVCSLRPGDCFLAELPASSSTVGNMPAAWPQLSQQRPSSGQRWSWTTQFCTTPRPKSAIVF